MRVNIVHGFLVFVGVKIITYLNFSAGIYFLQSFFLCCIEMHFSDFFGGSDFFVLKVCVLDFGNFF